MLRRFRSNVQFGMKLHFLRFLNIPNYQGQSNVSVGVCGNGRRKILANCPSRSVVQFRRHRKMLTCHEMRLRFSAWCRSGIGRAKNIRRHAAHAGKSGNPGHHENSRRSVNMSSSQKVQHEDWGVQNIAQNCEQFCGPIVWSESRGQPCIVAEVQIDCLVS